MLPTNIPRAVPTSPTTSFLPSVILLELQRQQVELQQSLQARLRELDEITEEPSPPPPVLNVLSPRSNSSQARIEAASRIEAAISAAETRSSPLPQKSTLNLQKDTLSGLMMGSSWRSTTPESNVPPHLRSSRQSGVQQVTLSAETSASLSSTSSSRPSSSKWKTVSKSLKSIASSSSLSKISSSEPSPSALTSSITSTMSSTPKELFQATIPKTLPPEAKRGKLPR